MKLGTKAEQANIRDAGEGGAPFLQGGMPGPVWRHPTTVGYTAGPFPVHALDDTDNDGGVAGCHFKQKGEESLPGTRFP